MTNKQTLMATALICATLGLQGLAHANPPPPPPVHRLDWTLSQTHPQGWTQGQPVSLLVGVGLSDPRHLWIGDSGPLPAESLTSRTATGWTRPIGLRVALRW